jgi:hypothetical protein
MSNSPAAASPSSCQNLNKRLPDNNNYQARRGTAQSTLDALIRLAKVLHVRLDDLVFGEHERGPGEDLALQFEAVSQFTEDEKQTVRELLEGMILKHEARRWDTSRAAAAEAAKAPAAGAKRQARTAGR